MREEENAQLIAAMTEAQIPHKLAIFSVMMWLPCEKTRTRGGGGEFVMEKSYDVI